MSSRQDVIPLFLTKIEKPKAVELIGVRVYFFVSMNGIERESQECARWDGHAVGKCEGTLGETFQPPFKRNAQEQGRNAISKLCYRDERNFGGLIIGSSIRLVSRTKLSNLHSLAKHV